MADAASKGWVNSELDRPSLLRTRDNMKDVFELIGLLPQKVAAVASSAEREFLSAYRVHMLSIQSELKELNDQVKAAEEQLKSDTQVESLEKEVSWFKEEKLRLQKNSDCMHQDLQSMSNKLKELHEQRKFLSEQLKTVMKRSRVLENELQSYGYNADNNTYAQTDPLAAPSPSARRRTGTNNNNNIINNRSRGNMLVSDVGSVGGRSVSSHTLLTEHNPTMDNSQKQKKRSMKTSKSLPSLNNNSNAQQQQQQRDNLSPLSRQLHQQQLPQQQQQQQQPLTLRKSHSHLHPAPVTQMSVNDPYEPLLNPNAKSFDETQSKHARTALNAIQSKRTATELNLESALRTVFKKIVSRKIQFAAQNSLSRADNKVATGENAEEGSQIQQTLVGSTSIGGVTGLGLEHFTDVDRMDAMITFLSNPQEFEKVIDALCDLV